VGLPAESRCELQISPNLTDLVSRHALLTRNSGPLAENLGLYSYRFLGNSETGPKPTPLACLLLCHTRSASSKCLRKSDRFLDFVCDQIRDAGPLWDSEGEGILMG